MAEKQRLFVDMDGTLAVFTPVDELETLYEEGYFLNQKPHENVVAAVKDIISNYPDIEVHILSAYLTDSKFALHEKEAWLDKYIPEIDSEHRIFVPCGSDKKEAIQGGVRSNDFLLDDYTKNLNDWQPPARGIKLLNAINHTRGSWEHDRIRYDRDPASLASGIVAVMRNERQVFDERVSRGNERESETMPEQTHVNVDWLLSEAMKTPYYFSVKSAITGLPVNNDGLIELEALMDKTRGTDAYDVIESIMRERNAEIDIPARTHREEVAARIDSIFGNESVSISPSKPQMAVLQLKHLPETEERSFRTREEQEERGIVLSDKDYDVVYLKDADASQSLEQIYSDLNGEQAPNYYGHSLSIGDVVVLRNSAEDTKAYMVSDFGFDALPDDFLSHDSLSRIDMGLDVREEHRLLDELNAFGAAEGQPTLSDAETDRLFYLNTQYDRIFDMADIRGLIADSQDRLEAIYNWQIANEVENADFRVYREGDRYYPNFSRENRTPERAENLIETFFNHADQWGQHDRDRTDVFQYHADPTNQYAAFVQRYERREGLTGIVPMNVVYTSNDPVQAMRVSSFLNTNSRYGELLRAEVDYRAKNNLPVLNGDEAVKGRLFSDYKSRTAQYAPKEGSQYEYVGNVYEVLGVDDSVVLQSVNDDTSVVVPYVRFMEHPETYISLTAENFPIQEFPDLNGKVLAGNEIGLFEANPTMEQGMFVGVSRETVYNAVRAFERDNNIQHGVINRDGSYDDKQFLYDGYDEYVAMSHATELSPYRDRFAGKVNADVAHLKEVFPDMTDEQLERNRESRFNLALAEVYYARQHGLSEDDIDFMIGDGTKDAELMRSTRKTLEGGSMNRRALSALEKLGDSYARERAEEYLSAGGNIAFIESISPRVDMGVAHAVFNALQEKSISEEKGAAIFEAAASLQEWNENNHTETGNYKFHSYDFEYLADAMTSRATKGMSVDALKQGVAAFIEAKGNGRLIDYLDNAAGRQNEKLVAAERIGEGNFFSHTLVTVDEKGEISQVTGAIYDGRENAEMFAEEEAPDATLVSFQELKTEANIRKLSSSYDIGTLQTELDARDDNAVEGLRDERFEPYSNNELVAACDRLQRLNEKERGDIMPENVKEESTHREDARAQAPVVPAPEDESLSPKDKLQAQLEAGVRAVQNSEVFKNWLATQSRVFSRQYSFQNAMLVWLQKPDASHTMGYEAWKDYGRNVKQGAVGAKIFVPLMASEKYQGGLFKAIKKDLTEQFAKDSKLQQAVFKLGNSNLEFTMNPNGLMGIRVGGKEKGVFSSDEECKRFIDRSVIGKVPVGFTVGTVFDEKDVVAPEYLWVKRGFTKDEVVKGEDGKPIKNKRGETKIINTPERQAKFQPSLDTSIAAKDPAKMAKLFEVLTAASERKGVPVFEKSKDEDEVLKGGASGYFSRRFTAEFPKGFIVIDSGLEATEKNAVLCHEMSHADLHGNLEALAQRMGEDKVPSAMREIQAEASAFAVAANFGIETDTSSFKYLAAYTQGFEQQDFQKSLEVIFKEVKDLTADIKAELDLRDLDLALEPKEQTTLEKETIQTITAKYVNFATEQDEKINAATKELPALVEASKGNAELMGVLKKQNENLEIRKQDIEGIVAGVDALNKATTRQEQDALISTIEAAVARVQSSNAAFDKLSEQFTEMAIAGKSQTKDGLKQEFEKAPAKTLEKMKKEFPRLAEMSAPQLAYIAKSKYIASEYGKLLNTDPKAFVEAACSRADNAVKVAAKNGTFAEVAFCEQWFDKPIFENGTLCHPKIAEKTIAGAEAQVQGMKAQAEKEDGEYVPYSKCDITVYAPDKKGGLTALHTRVDIGDGGQKGLEDHLNQIVGRSKVKREMVNSFSEAVAEKGAYKDKIAVPSRDVAPAQPAAVHENEAPAHERGEVNQSRGEWGEDIKQAKEADREAAEKAREEQPKEKSKKQDREK